nr:putative reverse transcriptase domain-containing protein [Tanacetum cinerariifolium]
MKPLSKTSCNCSDNSFILDGANDMVLELTGRLLELSRSGILLVELEEDPTIISCSKSQENKAKGCQIFLAQISAKKEEDMLERKQLEDVSVIWDYPEVFPKDLSGLPLARPVEFQ